jgi:two-component system LytT family response regulator
MKTRCLIVDDEPLARRLLQSHASRIENLIVVDVSSNALDAMAALQKQPVDLIFLDICMPELDGLQMIKALPHPPAIILTTAYREYGAEAFDLNVLDYLLKPIGFDRFLKAVNKYFDLNSGTSGKPDKNGSWFFVMSNRKKVRVELDQFILVESMNDRTQIHLKDRVIITRETISHIATKLPPDKFVRIHRSFIVSIAAIHRIGREGVEVGDRFLPFGRAYKLQAHKELGLEE